MSPRDRSGSPSWSLLELELLDAFLVAFERVRASASKALADGVPLEDLVAHVWKGRGEQAEIRCGRRADVLGMLRAGWLAEPLREAIAAPSKPDRLAVVVEVFTGDCKRLDVPLTELRVADRPVATATPTTPRGAARKA